MITTRDFIGVKHPVFLVDLYYVNCPRRAIVIMDGRDYSQTTYYQMCIFLGDFLREYPYPDSCVDSFSLVDKDTIEENLDRIVETEYKPYMKEWQ